MRKELESCRGELNKLDPDAKTTEFQDSVEIKQHSKGNGELDVNSGSNLYEKAPNK